MPHGDAGVVGPGGLASFGLRPQFYAWDFTDPHNPYQVAEYIDRVLDEGRHENWPYLRARLTNGQC